MSTAAAIVLAASAALGLLWFAFTRNGRRLVYVLAVAVHRLLAPATGQHGLDQPAGVLDMLRGIALAAAWRMPRYWEWEIVQRYYLRQYRRADRKAFAAEMQELREPVAASAPGDGPAPVPPAPGAGPLTGAPGGASPYPPPTAPQPALTEPPNPAPNWAPPVSWTPYEASVPEYLP